MVYLKDLGLAPSRNPLGDSHALFLLFHELILLIYAIFITSDAHKDSGSRGRAKR